MYTQCPGCLTIFRVPVDALAQAHGRARCGVCRAEFDILAALSEHLPEQSDGMLPRRGPGPVPLLSLAAPRPRSGQRELFVAVDSVPEAAPAFVSAAPLPRPAPRRRRSVWRWANAALIAGLLAQAAYATRTSWLDDARVRPYLDAACARLACRLPARRDLHQIALVARDVRPHPSVAGALVISASMLNRANFVQPYPTLEITLSNLDEKRIAMRRLSPPYYLSDAAALARGLPAGGTATIDLEVVDPGKQAVAFEFKFL
ncbi:MAG: DUF3426 domain-containing protein [Lysobacterales bacterium CG02_land_8_20_14_3_00_62_12]|nr:MAG: DUF3426 domain-containing protein [Xanthomonadales bacterium CG02_land_8_20_14_3_00_62_12]